MKKEETQIYQWIESVRPKIGGSPTFFKADEELINTILAEVKLNHFMSVSELKNALEILESLTIKEGYFKRVSFHDFLKKNGEATLSDIGLLSKLRENKLPDLSNKLLISKLEELHNLLLGFTHLSYQHAKEEMPLIDLHYQADQILESQAFFDLETSSKADVLPDVSTSIKDFVRKGVTIYDAVIIPKDPSNDKDPQIIEAIESFSESKIDVPHSRADKIYNFGGQFLDGILLQEFSNAVRLIENPNLVVQAGSVKGHINWSKNKEGVIKVTVHLKVLSGSYTDPLHEEKETKLMAIGTDGLSLVELEWDDYEDVLLKCQKERAGITEENIAPIASLTGTFVLEKNPDLEEGYFLKAEGFSMKINTPQLIPTKLLHADPTMTPF